MDTIIDSKMPSHPGNKDSPVILLFGMPRSGTTWIGKIFDSHPDTLYRHEPDSYLPVQKLPLLVSAGEQHCCQEIKRYTDELVNSCSPVVTTKLPLFTKNYASFGRYSLYKLSVYASIIMSRLTRKIDLSTISPIGKVADGNIFLVWKSIESLGRIGAISDCLDNCRSIHIIRHPCGYVSSILKGEEQARFFNQIKASEGYRVFEKLLATDSARNYGLTMEQLKQLSPVGRLAWRWVLFNEHALREMAPRANCMTVRYEDLCADPGGITRQLFEFSGLNWNAQTASFLRSSTSGKNGSYYGVVRNPQQTAFKWREMLTNEQISEIDAVVQQTRLGSLYEDIPIADSYEQWPLTQKI